MMLHFVRPHVVLLPDHRRSDIVFHGTDIDARQLMSDQNQAMVCVDIQHAGNNKLDGYWQIQQECEWSGRQFAVVECEHCDQQPAQTVFWDFMWNRSKAYYNNFEFRTTRWYHHTVNDFGLWPLLCDRKVDKVFVSANKVTRSDLTYRPQLARWLLKNFSHTGWISQIGIDNQWQCLASQGQAPDHTDPHTVIKLSPININGYRPVHNAFYHNSYVSVFCETLETGSTILISEKTIDPLIKGHFILPFGTAGLIEAVLDRQFLLPDFIDYSYDKIKDDQSRFDHYLDEVKRLLCQPMDFWRKNWFDNFDIIQHNRNLLRTRDYNWLDLQQFLRAH